MDEVIKSDLHYQEHTGVLTHKTSQPTEKAILERNQDLRNAEQRKLGKGTQTWGRQVASVPMIIVERAIRDGYELNSKDQKHAQKEMFRFLQSDMGKACLVTEKL